MCFDVSDIIHANELSLTFKLLVDAFLFSDDKGLIKQKLLLWPQVPFYRLRNILFLTFCSGVIAIYLVVGMYFSFSQIFFRMKIFVSIFILPLFLRL